MFRWLLPKNTNFFDYFEQHCQLIIEACQELHALVSTTTDIQTRVERISQIERKSDEIAHQCIEAIHKTFITPIDRSEIYHLISRMDDIIDAVDAATSRIAIYEIMEMRSDASQLSDVLVRATGEIALALKGLRNMKHAQLIKDKCVKIYHLENEGDTILRSSLAKLFKEENKPILVIKWKEIYQRLERAIDRCEDVANIIEGIVIEAT
jgi:uncharacterized protein Yka (UPF0111/DUF47 family)